MEAQALTDTLMDASSFDRVLSASSTTGALAARTGATLTRRHRGTGRTPRARDSRPRQVSLVVMVPVDRMCESIPATPHMLPVQ